MANKIKDKANLKQQWDNIFRSPDPFGIPFRESLTNYLIFYPTEGYYLTESQYSAIIGTARQFGNKGFWVSESEWDRGDFSTGEHWWCEFPAYNNYIRLPLALESAMYARYPSWGLIISHEDHAIVGGTRQFIKNLKLRYPIWQSDLSNLREFWSKYSDGNWLNEVINKIR